MVNTNRQVAETLTFMGQLLEIHGGDAYKIRAYYRAADLVDRLMVPVAGMSIEELMQIRGIGKALAVRIRSIAETGTFQELDDLRADIPKSLLELLKLNGVGPKTINKLWKRLGVQSIDDMEREARAHRIRAVPGFGERREADILTSIEFYRQQQSGRMPLPIADGVVGAVTAVMEDGSYTVAGSYRRGKSTVGDIDIISTETPQTLNPRLREIADEVIDEGERRTSIRIRGQRVDIRFTEQRQFGSMLFYLTGSRDFNIRLREIAIARGWRINEYGVEERQTGKIFEFDNEGKLFEFLGMQYVPPELRENWGEIERAFQHALPPLVTLDEIRSDLHVHTVMSDGHLTSPRWRRSGGAHV
jgi:DNA polymerase (family X)